MAGGRSARHCHPPWSLSDPSTPCLGLPVSVGLEFYSHMARPTTYSMSQHFRAAGIAAVASHPPTMLAWHSVKLHATSFSLESHQYRCCLPLPTTSDIKKFLIHRSLKYLATNSADKTSRANFGTPARIGRAMSHPSRSALSSFSDHKQTW